MNRKGNTIIWAIVACLLWSTAYASIKLGLQYDTPLHFAGTRFMISGILILPFTLRPRVYIKMIGENWGVVAWVTVLQTVVNYSLFYLGLSLVPGAIGAIIVGSQPLVTAIVASVMHDDDKLTRKKIVTIVFGISGVVLISIGHTAFKFGTAKELVGVVMLLAANIAVSVSNVIVSARSNGIRPLVLSSSSLFAGGVLLFMISLPLEGVHSWDYPLDYWLLLAWLSFMAAAAFSIWFILLQRPGVKVSELNLWKFIIPVVGAVLSWLMVPGEKPDWLTVTGIFITTISLIMFYRNPLVSLHEKAINR